MLYNSQNFPKYFSISYEIIVKIFRIFFLKIFNIILKNFGNISITSQNISLNFPKLFSKLIRKILGSNFYKMSEVFLEIYRNFLKWFSKFFFTILKIFQNISRNVVKYRVIYERRNPTFRHRQKMKTERKNADQQQRTAGTCSSNIHKK